jgi:hypothetical protein
LGQASTLLTVHTRKADEKIAKGVLQANFRDPQQPLIAPCALADEVGARKLTMPAWIKH